MPKYIALSLLLSREDEKYIQPGEVFEIDDQEKETILLEAGLIKAATVPMVADGSGFPETFTPVEPPVKKSKHKSESGGSA